MDWREGGMTVCMRNEMYVEHDVLWQGKRSGTREKRDVTSLATEAKLDAEVQAHQVGAILVLASDVNIELSGRDFSGQSHSVLELVVAGREGALKVGIVGSCLLADIESTSQKPDETELDHDVGKSSILYTQMRLHMTVARV